MNKKGDLSLNYIVIAALALVVLVVIILFFTGGLKTLFTLTKEHTLSASDQELAIWRGQCELYCAGEQKANFCNNEFKSKDPSITTKYKCKDTTLNVGCNKITC